MAAFNDKSDIIRKSIHFYIPRHALSTKLLTNFKANFKLAKRPLILRETYILLHIQYIEQFTNKHNKNYQTNKKPAKQTPKNPWNKIHKNPQNKVLLLITVVDYCLSYGCPINYEINTPGTINKIHIYIDLTQALEEW